MSDSKDAENESRNDINFDIPKEHEFKTVSGRNFSQAMGRTITVMHFLIDLAIGRDYSNFIANEALAGRDIVKTDNPLDVVEDLDKSKRPHLTFIRKNNQFIMGLFLVRVIDDFSTYLANVVRETLHSQPNLLKSQDQIKVDYALQFDSIEDLHKDLIGRKISELSFLGFEKLSEWSESRLGLPICSDSKKKSVVVESIELRNIIVHNDAVVGSRYLKKVRECKFKLDEIRKIDPDEFYFIGQTLLEVVAKFDSDIARKFSIELSPDSAKEIN